MSNIIKLLITTVYVVTQHTYKVFWSKPSYDLVCTLSNQGLGQLFGGKKQLSIDSRHFLQFGVKVLIYKRSQQTPDLYWGNKG